MSKTRRLKHFSKMIQADNLTKGLFIETNTFEIMNNNKNGFFTERRSKSKTVCLIKWAN